MCHFLKNHTNYFSSVSSGSLDGHGETPLKGTPPRTACLIRVQGRAMLLTEDDVDNLTLVLFHVIQQVFFAGRFETTNTTTEE